MAQPCADEIRHTLFRLLKETALPALDVLYYNGELGSDEELPYCMEERIKKACPRLMALIRQTESDFCDSLAEALWRVAEYRAEIGTTLLQGRIFRQITGLEFGAGDRHNGGRCVIIFTTDAGKFVYKPHTLAADRIVRHLAEGFFPGLFYVPQVVCGKNFGFCEFVENRPAATDRAARLYYYRLGGFCAVSRMLGAADLHRENMLSHDAVPVPVDFETAFSPVLRRSIDENAQRELADTLHASCLLPTQVNEQECSFLFDTSDQNVSAPVVDGERKTLGYYLDDFLRGFRETYRRGMAQRAALLTFAERAENFPVRIVLRSTAGYMKLLRRARQWKWLCAPELGNEVKRVLSLAVKDYVPAAGQAERETAAILRCDVPYFTVDMDGHDLCDAGGIAEKACIDISPREHFIRCLRLLSEEDLAFHCRLFTEAVQQSGSTPPKPRET